MDGNRESTGRQRRREKKGWPRFRWLDDVKLCLRNVGVTRLKQRNLE
jgi:hypothetical protein